MGKCDISMELVSWHWFLSISFDFQDKLSPLFLKLHCSKIKYTEPKLYKQAIIRLAKSWLTDSDFDSVFEYGASSWLTEVKR